MHFSHQSHDCFYQETVATADSASFAARRRKLRDRRRSPTAPAAPSTPQRITTEELAEALRPHLLSPEKMWELGYPIEIEPNSSKVVMYINPPPRPRANPFTPWDVNAPVFVPGGSQSDSGRGSWGSTPRSDSDEEADAVEHLCVRCDKTFYVTREGDYHAEDLCSYHSGRLSVNNIYSCCKERFGARGCTVGRCHVWNGTRPGMNGPLEGYVRARSPRGGVYAIDAEMCYTTAGLELASIAVITIDGRLVYRSLVIPSSQVLDCNTRFSGIRPRDLMRATKTLRDVQNDILGFVGTDTILIGHALENDLRALKLLHSTVVDTCALYPHARGFPMRRSLRSLSEEYLGRSVQQGYGGHSPLEDARAAMDLVLLKVNEEKKNKQHESTSHQLLPVLQPYDLLVSEDGSVILWDIRDLNQKEHKTLRVNIEFDHASHVVWSPDSKAFIIHTVRENHIVVYKIERKKDGVIGAASPLVVYDKVHADDVVGFGISTNGKFMMSCSCKTDMVIWDLKGQQLDRLDTYLMSTYSAKISPCGRFVVATGFAPDVKVMEVCFTKTGEYKQVTKAFELTGHTSGVYDVAFDVDTSHIATISKDGTWKLYHTKIEYTRGESPHVLETGTYTQTANHPRIALSPNSEVLAVSVDSNVEFYDTYTGKLYDTVENVYSGLINYMKFDASGKYLFVCGDRAVRILHNVCGYYTTIGSCTRLLGSKQTSATVERLNKTIQDCKETLATFGK